MAINMSTGLARPGNEGRDSATISPVGLTDDANNSLTQYYITRGTLDLGENRLPTLNDTNVRPSDPLVKNNAFLITTAGTAPSGVVGKTTLAVGDYLVFTVDGDATVASNWAGVTNSAMPANSYAINSGYYKTNPAYVKIVGDKLPFFP